MVIKPIRPIEVKLNWGNWIKLLTFWFICLILLIVLFVSSISIFVYYIKSIITNGWLHEETIKFSLYLVIGAYFFLILDREKIYSSLEIKKDLPFITLEQRDYKNLKNKNERIK